LSQFLLASLLALHLCGLAAAAGPLPLQRATRLEARGQVTAFFDDDLDATYGLLPGGELGASWALGHFSRVLVSLGYGATTGDPYHDVPDFDAGEVARLRVVPLTVGLRLASPNEGPVHLVCGAAVQAAWFAERLPIGETDGSLQDLDGRGLGLLFTLGPEWWLQGGRQVLSLDLALGGPSGEVHGGTHRHDVDLRSFQLRLGYALAVGSGEVH